MSNNQLIQILGHHVRLGDIENPHVRRAIIQREGFWFNYGDSGDDGHTDHHDRYSDWWNDSYRDHKDHYESYDDHHDYICNF